MYDTNQWKEFILPYKFGLDDLKTKINIMVEEAFLMGENNSIEHIKTRIKTPSSMLEKLKRKRIEPTLENAKQHLLDIVGVRIVCSFVSDIYEIYNLFLKRKDLKVVEVKDYIRNPKPNGYQSLHLIVQIPVQLTHRVEHVMAEIQLRTLAMDFWASLEHKIFYKYNRDIPQYLKDELKEAADSVKMLDEKMKGIRDEVNAIDAVRDSIFLPL
ncbi:GTP pyrophosphokinase [Heyndrickxia shackletonii]|uniref:GTP pyrophosphokinase n=1 Tax=Heyndrickxia shackletonii TaxID=157838 RepID=A0A0Q3WWU2_9BACI|nr:GTP pyrophosphokinase family protein [Heyndrickxia shackletonii]KQL53147.1 GTP pyrophosphokinase [Heyndrickxia shackletonii]NEZ00669.1 GTP pyrophosphokinase family protein [Heyndrickxia shackletonii]